MNYILLTSCFKPLLNQGVSNRNVLANIQYAHETAEKFLCSQLCRDHDFQVHLIDCSNNDTLDKLELCAIDKFFISNSSLCYHNIHFTPLDIECIQTRGKGYSEILMIDRFLRNMSLPQDAIIFKSSARYIPLFSPTSCFPFFVGSVSSFAYSHLARKAIAHSYICSVSLLQQLISFTLSKLDDKNGIILESLIYQFSLQSLCISSPGIKRSLFYPFYHPKVIPGTTTSRPFSSSLVFQFLRSIVCLF